jgi:DNA-binding XRE family transcriptional regulator
MEIPPRILAGDFAGWLRDAMDQRRMSYRMVALHAGVDHATVHRLASGDRLPSLVTAIAIIRVFQRPAITLPSAAASRAATTLDRSSVAGAS